MLDLFELERLFNNWLRLRSSMSCAFEQHFDTNGSLRIITIDICSVDQYGNKHKMTSVSASGINPEKVWDEIYDKIFAYLMEVAKHVE